jgi:hypothetical protein
VDWKLAAFGTAPVNDGRPDGFEEKQFGKGMRLVWEHGACAIVGAIAYWKRFAVMVTGRTLTVVAADRPDVVEIGTEHVRDASGASTHGGVLSVRRPAGILTIPLADLEHLVRDAPAEIAITVATSYPLRDRSARVPAKVVWLSNADALVNIQETPVRQIRLDAKLYGLEKGMEIAFVDQLGPGAYVSLDVPGRPRQTLFEPPSPQLGTAWCRRTVLRDPATGAWDSIPRTDRSVALVAQLAASPDDDSARDILLDALADAGEPCAATFALLRAGKRVSNEERDAALGPLVHFLTDIKLRGGLPASASVVNQPPDDEAAIAAFLADLRLAMLDTLRLKRGPEPLYCKIIGSPNLVGLRRADGSSHPILEALRDRRAGQLTHLYGVSYTNKLAMSLVSDPAFASVRYLELVCRGNNVARRAKDLLDELAALAEHERHITFDAYPRDAEIIAKLVVPAFRELGLASFAIAGLTIERTERGIQARTADSTALALANLARTTFEEV